jgi:hypothetical protein
MGENLPKMSPFAALIKGTGGQKNMTVFNADFHTNEPSCSQIL